MRKTFALHPGRLGLSDLRRLAADDLRLVLAADSDGGIAAGRRLIDTVIEEGKTTYGVNTGFGSLSNTSIAKDDLAELQRRLVLSNAAGTGPPLPDAVVRLILCLKINTLAGGRSGVRRELVDALLALYNAKVVPLIPAKGSVGASGDLAPLAHLAVALIGEGDVRLEGETLTAREGLARTGLVPFRLAPKEGLAMVNGTQMSTALAVAGLFAVEAVFAATIVAGALSVEAALGQHMAFDPRIHQARGQRGQVDVAAALCTLLAGSDLRDVAAREGRLQDPYCLRCQPQVMGACLDHFRHGAEIIAREVNAATDNPLVFAEDGDILYGGNFHAEPVGLASDSIALALSEIGAMAERRVAMLTDANHSLLPPFLVRGGGLDSGFMVAQVTAAALASENKGLAFPATADSIPTTANHEDFVSMSARAAYRLEEMADNAAAIAAIELLAACQGLEFRRPARSSKPLEAAVAAVRERVPAYDTDRFFAPDLAAIKDLVRGGRFLDLVPASLRLTS